MSRRYSVLALALLALLGLAVVAPARASVIYNLSFDNWAGNVVEGTGTLTLNLTSVSDAYNLNTSDSSHALFGSVSTGNIDGHGSFLLNWGNIDNFYIQTGNVGQIYTLTVAQTVPSSNYVYPPTNILILDLYTNTWQIHGQYDSTVDAGTLLVAGPSLGTADAPTPGETPLPAALPLFGTALGALGLFASSRKRKKLIAAV